MIEDIQDKIYHLDRQNLFDVCTGLETTLNADIEHKNCVIRVITPSMNVILVFSPKKTMYEIAKFMTLNDFEISKIYQILAGKLHEKQWHFERLPCI